MLVVVDELYLPACTIEMDASPEPQPGQIPSVSSTEKIKPKKRRRPRAEKALIQNAHYELVLEAAQVVTSILHQHGLSCAVFGSLAAKLYGSARSPKDVDMLVSQEMNGRRALLSAAQLKDLILDSDPRHFYLKLPRDPAAEYRILWYRQEYLGPECKVDILVPGTMFLPRLPPRRVVFLSPRAEEGGERVIGRGKTADGDAVPVVPFALLLAHKLQGWDDHRLAEEPRYKEKQHQDAADVRRLLGLQREVKLLVEGRRFLDGIWKDEELFGKEFQSLTKLRVKMYCAAFPDRETEWWTLGFETVECVF